MYSQLNNIFEKDWNIIYSYNSWKSYRIPTSELVNGAPNILLKFWKLEKAFKYSSCANYHIQNMKKNYIGNSVNFHFTQFFF